MSRKLIKHFMMIFCMFLILTGNLRDTSGYSWFNVSGVNVVWIEGESIRELSPSVFSDGSDTQFLFLGALGLWNIIPATNFEYFYSLPEEDFPLNPEDGFNDTTAVAASELDPGVLGVTYLVNQGAEWFDMDMVFPDQPDGVGWNFDTNPACETLTAPTPTNGYSFILVSAHELGHALGLGHDPTGTSGAWFVATMNPRYPSGGTIGQQNIVELHTDDRNGLRFLYPNSGPSQPDVVDLALSNFTAGPLIGKAAPLSITPSSTIPGVEIIVDSVIENFGSTNEFFVRQGFYLSSDPFITQADYLLGDLTWDIAFEDLLAFEVGLMLPEDWPAGEYYIGSIIDDTDQVFEDFEDNNTVSYCNTLQIIQQEPVFSPLGQQSAQCGISFTGPTPVLDFPLNMGPVSWTIDNPEQGMTINPATGVVSWSSPESSDFLYTIFVRATNDAGSSTELLFIGVEPAEPVLLPINDEIVSCHQPYSGPVPVLSNEGCMNPVINWSIDSGPPGMTIDFDTGILSWDNPVPSDLPYDVTIRATNAAGNGTVNWKIEVVSSTDFDGDAETDIEDYPYFNDCFTGPGVTIINNACYCADLDRDGDVDLQDYTKFMQAFDGLAPQDGACCVGGDNCSVGSLADCNFAGGTYLGDNTICEQDSCIGACCFETGCIELSQNQCGIASGEFSGSGTSCDPLPCAQPTGACCIDNSCIVTTEILCIQSEGEYYGNDSNCNDVNCTPAPRGACCIDDNSCQITTQQQCENINGDYKGDNIICDQDTCQPDPIGACCLFDTLQCQELTQSQCQNAGGSFEGENTICASAVCGEYRNDTSFITDYWPPGAGVTMGDDIELIGTDREVIYYELAVFGGGPGSGNFDVTASLYTACPGDGGTMIPGTEASWQNVIEDDITILSVSLENNPAIVGDSLYLVAEFSTNNAGWVMAGPAEAGVTLDEYGEEDTPWVCTYGFSGGLYSGFWALINCR